MDHCGLSEKESRIFIPTQYVSFLLRLWRRSGSCDIYIFVLDPYSFWCHTHSLHIGSWTVAATTGFINRRIDLNQRMRDEKLFSQFLILYVILRTGTLQCDICEERCNIYIADMYHMSLFFPFFFNFRVECTCSSLWILMQPLTLLSSLPYLNLLGFHTYMVRNEQC